MKRYKLVRAAMAVKAACRAAWHQAETRTSSTAKPNYRPNTGKQER